MLATPGAVQPGHTQPFLPSQTQKASKAKGKAKGKEESSVLMGLKAAFHLMRKKIITSPKDCLGIIVYNTVRGTLFIRGGRLLTPTLLRRKGIQS